MSPIAFVCLTMVLLAFGAGCAFGVILGRRQLSAEAQRANEAARKDLTSMSNPKPGTAGWTILAALNGLGCLGRSRQDEPVFVICARDRAAAPAVVAWAIQAEKLGARPSKVKDALAIAEKMTVWRETTGNGGKVPD